VSLSTIAAWLRVLSDPQQDSNLIFLGGEPTLHPDLAQAVKIAGNLGYDSITIDTNGFLFNNILDRVAPADVGTFSFSLDGSNPDTNDRIRGEGSFAACISGVAAAKKRGFNTSLIYTVSSENIADLQQMVSLLGHLEIDRFYIQVIGLRGRAANSIQEPADRAALQVSGADWLDTVPAIAMKIAAMGIAVVYPKVYLLQEEPFECAGRVADNYFIFPNGRVYRCPLCEDFPINGLTFQENGLVSTPPINENDLFDLTVPEGCVMNKIIQPGNILYQEDGRPRYKIACCMLKEEIICKGFF
jgi:MoaA/NifB/PqqE/SkfB family radical SAM enzyme